MCLAGNKLWSQIDAGLGSKHPNIRVMIWPYKTAKFLHAIRVDFINPDASLERERVQHSGRLIKRHFKLRMTNEHVDNC